MSLSSQMDPAPITATQEPQQGLASGLVIMTPETQLPPWGKTSLNPTTLANSLPYISKPRRLLELIENILQNQGEKYQSVNQYQATQCFCAQQPSQVSHLKM